MKKIITTLTAVTFALGLAAAAQAQTVKTPEKPGVKTEVQTTPSQVAPKKEEAKGPEALKPAAKAEVKAEDKKEAKKHAKKTAKKGKEEKCVTPQGEKK